MGDFHKVQVPPCVLVFDGQAMAGMLKGKQRCSYGWCDGIVTRNPAHHQQMFQSCIEVQMSQNFSSKSSAHTEGHDAGASSDGSFDAL